MESSANSRRKAKTNRDWYLVALGAAMGILGQTMYDAATYVFNQTIPNIAWAKYLAGLFAFSGLMMLAYNYKKRSEDWMGIAKDEAEAEKMMREAQKRRDEEGS